MQAAATAIGRAAQGPASHGPAACTAFSRSAVSRGAVSHGATAAGAAPDAAAHCPARHRTAGQIRRALETAALAGIGRGRRLAPARMIVGSSLGAALRPSRTCALAGPVAGSRGGTAPLRRGCRRPSPGSRPANSGTGSALAVTERVIPHGVEYARATAAGDAAPPSRRRCIVAGRRLEQELRLFLVRCRLRAVMAGSIPS